MAEEKIAVQFSQDGTLYHVPAFPLKHAWLSTATYDSPEAAIAAVNGVLMPFSGLCRFERKKIYYRFFLNQSYHAVKAGELREVMRDDVLVEDFVNAKALESASGAGTAARPTGPEKSAPKGKKARK